MDFKLHYVPSLICVWFISALLISYTFAIKAENVYPILPYISELGIQQPSSVIFGQMMNVGALLVVAGVYIRYKQLDFVIKTRITKLNKKWNEISFYQGFLFSIGLSLAANFPADLKGYRFNFFIHMIGASLVFGCGYAYMLIQNKITFILQPYYDRYPKVAVSKFIQYFRSVITFCYGISSIITFVYLRAYLRVHDADSQFCAPDSPGYTHHLISAIAEWAMTILFFAFTITLTNELKFMSFKEFCFDNCVDNNGK